MAGLAPAMCVVRSRPLARLAVCAALRRLATFPSTEEGGAESVARFV